MVSLNKPAYNLRVWSAPILIDFREKPLLKPLEIVARGVYENCPKVKAKGHQFYDHHWVQFETDDEIIIIDKSMKGDVVIEKFDSIEAMEKRMKRWNVVLSTIYPVTNIANPKDTLVDDIVVAVNDSSTTYRFFIDNCKHLAEDVSREFQLVSKGPRQQGMLTGGLKSVMESTGCMPKNWTLQAAAEKTKAAGKIEEVKAEL